MIKSRGLGDMYKEQVENHWWDKASDLMNQMVCAADGVIFLDFSEGVRYETVSFSLGKYGLDLSIVNTGRGHADLAEKYSTILREMYAVVEKLGESRLADVRELVLLTTLSDVHKRLDNDRALLHALRFFEEEKRVDETREAATGSDSDELLRLMEGDDKPSYEWLQNAYHTEDPEEQPILLTLCLTEPFLKRCAHGTCRIHGGGFADVIMAILSREEREGYTAFLLQYFGKKSIYRMGLRRFDAVKADF